MRILQLLTLSLIVGCSGQNYYRNESDIRDIQKLQKIEFVTYLKNNSSNALKERVCQGVFGREQNMQEFITKAEASACLISLLPEVEVQNVVIPYKDIERGSALANYAYLMSTLEILKSNSPYEFGANDNVPGSSLINSIEKINNLKK
ncbi:hypothetical protein A9Q84_14495 [Halobacteriovorax marinus]|uniref:Lipoprotein n=1 Tax=Halobacteriovorax marinus TaxID=97084 RepID=A0A1Y5F4W9_9BACT|nr:hypothetical protein A9Q84_14495 [Halobacteriovorax marinus]